MPGIDFCFAPFEDFCFNHHKQLERDGLQPESLDDASATDLGSLQLRMLSRRSLLMPIVSLAMSQVAPRKTNLSFAIVDFLKDISQPKRLRA